MESTEKLPDIGLIRGEKRYFIEVLTKVEKEIKRFPQKMTKRRALKDFNSRASMHQAVRVVHDGQTAEGVPMLMVAVSANWKMKEKS
jgi:5-bromo-4-chloroindolyl phosphate hydrolysis protein